MIISASGSFAEVTVGINTDFAPSAEYAIKWARASNGKLLKTDRGAISDLHSCTVAYTGSRTVIEALYSRMIQQSDEGLFTVTLEAGEYLFGPAGSLGTMSLIAADVGELKQTSLNVFSFDVTWILPAQIAYHTAYSNILPLTFLPDHSITKKTDRYFSATPFYSVAVGGYDRVQQSAEYREFAFSQIMDSSAAAQFQMYFESVNRGARIANTGPDFIIAGFDHPFGVGDGWPCAFHITDVSFSPASPSLWRVSVNIAKAK